MFIKIWHRRKKIARAVAQFSVIGLIYFGVTTVNSGSKDKVTASPTQPVSSFCSEPFNAQGVANDPETICPLKAGAPLPNVSLLSLSGKTQSLDKLTKNKKSLIVFYRGGWCPYCSRQLQGLQEIQGELKKLGVQIISISPDRSEKLNETMGKVKLDYALFSDSDMTAAKAFGVAFQLDDEEVKRLAGYNIDLVAASGKPHNQLPVPAVFLIDDKAVVRFVYANPDYKIRVDSKVLLKQAQAL